MCERFIHFLLVLSSASTILILGTIFIFLFITGIGAFAEISPKEFLFGRIWNPEAYGEPSWGILSLVVGTVYVSVGGLLVATPLGVASAVYLAEIASPATRNFLKPIIEMIAGLPSVVLGLFGLLVLAPLLSDLLNIPYALNGLTASILVGFMALPTIISISEDVLSSVPASYREASLALGATHWQTIKSVVLPAASRGIMASIMLGLGRVVGETMVVLMVAGNSKAFPKSILDPVRPITANIAIEIKEVVVGSLHYKALFAMGLLLFLVTLIINLVGDIAIRRGVTK
ncbi:MAG: phosphate ABC transporter permease subunit PstC [Methanobacteriota archaeon]|nr:MAG: phosphate ABC transporter permease subunit PstC [Euryarchaeota archaeon]